ncbi:antibiotic biosynthesis monooxygenase [Streptomyces scabichelini]|uniref:antibiotic biosynthesis monooxygenase n=1 Tax=Streptomyces scabichelini TaxID=2711217 RepID=UPI0019CF60FA
MTVVVTRVIRPGKEEQFARWADDVDRTAARFPGHLGGVRLHDSQGLNHLIYRFDSAEHLHAWENSTERHALIRRGDEISDQAKSTNSGLDPWFTLSGGAVPPRWKTFLITWAAAYPTLLALSTALAQLAPGLPQPAALALTSAILTAVLTWLVLPRITRQVRPWLFRGARPAPASRPSPTRESPAGRPYRS